MFKENEEVLLLDVMKVLEEKENLKVDKDINYKMFLETVKIFKNNENHTYLAGPVLTETGITFQVACDIEAKPKKQVPFIVVKTLDEAIEYIKNLIKDVV